MVFCGEILNGTYLGDVEGCLVRMFVMGPAGKSGWMVGQKFSTGPRLGDLERILVGNFGTAPGWENHKDFWLENVKVNCSVKRMEMWSVDPKEDVPWSNGRVRAWRMGGMGAGWDTWTADYSEVPKPRLFAHTHQYAGTKGVDLLLDVDHES